jgi:hypothetical protein
MYGPGTISHQIALLDRMISWAERRGLQGDWSKAHRSLTKIRQSSHERGHPRQFESETHRSLERRRSAATEVLQAVLLPQILWDVSDSLLKLSIRDGRGSLGIWGHLDRDKHRDVVRRHQDQIRSAESAVTASIQRFQRQPRIENITTALRALEELVRAIDEVDPMFDEATLEEGLDELVNVVTDRLPEAAFSMLFEEIGQRLGERGDGSDDSIEFETWIRRSWRRVSAEPQRPEPLFVPTHQARYVAIRRAWRAEERAEVKRRAREEARREHDREHERAREDEQEKRAAEEARRLEQLRMEELEREKQSRALREKEQAEGQRRAEQAVEHERQRADRAAAELAQQIAEADALAPYREAQQDAWEREQIRRFENGEIADLSPELKVRAMWDRYTNRRFERWAKNKGLRPEEVSAEVREQFIHLL